MTLVSQERGSILQSAPEGPKEQIEVEVCVIQEEAEVEGNYLVVLFYS